MSGEDKARQASKLLQEAFDESDCKWCARNLEQLAKLAGDLATVMPYTSRTAEEVRKRSEPEIAALGGKIGVLKRVVSGSMPQTVGNSTPVEQFLYSSDEDSYPRGLSMDKGTITSIVAGSLTLGAGMGFVMNRLDAMFQLGTSWYMKVGPIINIVGGLVLLYMGYKGKLFKTEKMKYFAIAGGASMLSNGILKLVENGMAANFAGASPGRAFVNARAPGQLPYRMVEETKSY
jgi:hypothetical protein